MISNHFRKAPAAYQAREIVQKGPNNQVSEEYPPDSFLPGNQREILSNSWPKKKK